MAFATATDQKIGKYLGYPADDTSQATIAAALAAIEGMSDATYSAAAVTTIEAYLTTLDTLAAGIIAEVQVEGSTIIDGLRREYRRHCALVAIATKLEVHTDTAGASQT